MLRGWILSSSMNREEKILKFVFQEDKYPGTVNDGLRKERLKEEIPIKGLFRLFESKRIKSGTRE